MFLMTEPVRTLAATGRAELSFREIVETHKRAVYFLALDLTGNHHDTDACRQMVVENFTVMISMGNGASSSS